jgi:hypothetical protein
LLKAPATGKSIKRKCGYIVEQVEQLEDSEKSKRQRRDLDTRELTPETPSCLKVDRMNISS